MNPRVAVIGGGMAGLETAVRLALSDDIDVEIFERGTLLPRDHIAWDPTTHPHDEKIQRWTSTGWGAGGGLRERLGGRSLFYTGVMLEIELAALADWPGIWSSLLAGDKGLYALVRNSLTPEFPELAEQMMTPLAAELGLMHVPQAGKLNSRTGKLHIYSPLEKMVALASAQQPRLRKGNVTELINQKDGRWSVRSVGTQDTVSLHKDFDVCILCASAIGNIQILSQTLDQEISTSITDHISVGAIVRLSGGQELGIFRHEKLWSGYLHCPVPGTNIFVQEMQRTPNGDRMIDICAVIEQSSNLEEYSQLVARPSNSGESASAHINAVVSPGSQNRVTTARKYLMDFAHRIAPHALSELCLEETSYEAALHAVLHGRSGSIALYSFPYGAFEHEACTHPIGSNRLFMITPELEVQQLPGVFTAGPGNFPRLGTANPALTILAMSRKLADTVLLRYS